MANNTYKRPATKHEILTVLRAAPTTSWSTYGITAWLKANNNSVRGRVSELVKAGLVTAHNDNGRRRYRIAAEQ